MRLGYVAGPHQWFRPRSCAVSYGTLDSPDGADDVLLIKEFQNCTVNARDGDN